MTQMRVNIDEIKDQVGLRRAWDLPREQLDEMVKDEKAGYRASQPAHVDLRLEKLERRVLVSGQTRVELTCPCGRCLTTATVAVPVDFKLTLVPVEELSRDQEERGKHGERHDRADAAAAGSFEAQDADEETYTGKVIDLAPILREQVLLALPGYPVCREGCKGLCPVCGANLNDRECGCDRHVPDPRWAGLKKVKLQ
jgi:uncharacterized protein